MNKKVLFYICMFLFFACDKKETHEELPPGNNTQKFLQALQSKDALAIRNIVKQGFDPNIEIESNFSPLHCVILQTSKCPYDKQVVEALTASIDIDSQKNGGLKHETPLQLAAATNFKTGVEDLLALGANPNILSDEGSVLHTVVKSYLKGASDEKLSILELLLKNNKTDKNIKDKHNHTPLFYAYKTRNGKDLEQDDLDDMKPIRDLFENYGVKTYG